MSVRQKVQKILFSRSGNRCAMPDCYEKFVVEKTDKDRESLIGEIAHIKGEKPNSARYDDNMIDEERNSYDNLIAVCSNCHKKIDDQPNEYTAEKLVKIKKEHEKKVEKMIEKEIPNFTFAELDVIVKHLISDQHSDLKTDYILIPPKDKIKKNNLSDKTGRQIIMGMVRVDEVKNYIEKNPDLQFGERLKKGFVDEYERLFKEGYKDDELFEAMYDFASGKSSEFKIRAAGLSILVYLFERCEVFEK